MKPDQHLDLTRRLILAGMGAFMPLATTQVWAQPIFTVTPFQLGVAAGDPQPDGFVIWTRLAPRPLEIGHGMPSRIVEVEWQVASDANFATVVQSGTTVARPELAHAVHVEVAGLQAGQPYWYRFSAGGERSPTGRAKTAPPPGSVVDRVRFGVVGCQHYETGYFTAHRKLAGEDLDFIFHYGDYIYEGRGSATRNGPEGPVEAIRSHFGGEIYSLDDYRRRYAQYKMDLDLQAAHASAAFFTVWDDHETDNNWARDIDQDNTPIEVFALRRQAAAQAYYEHMPLRRRSFPAGASIQLYRRAAYGSLVELNFLDTRQFRDDQVACPAAPAACNLDAPQQFLGPAQEAWLLQGLAASKARWNVMAQQVMFMDLDRDPGASYRANADSWAGYRTPRARLLTHLRDRQVSNPVVLTGDEHVNYAGELHLDGRNPEGRPIATEFVATSVTSGGDGVDQTPNSVALLGANPQLKFINNQRGYVVCDVNAERWVSEFKVLDRVTERGGSLTTRTRLAIAAGDPRLSAA